MVFIHIDLFVTQNVGLISEGTGSTRSSIHCFSHLFFCFISDYKKEKKQQMATSEK